MAEFTRTWNETEMRYLNGGPSELKDDDERRVIKETREIGGDVRLAAPARQARSEDEGEGQGHEQRAGQMPTCRG